MLICYLYGEAVTLTDDNAVAVAVTARMYGAPRLLEHALAFLRKRLERASRRTTLMPRIMEAVGHADAAVAAPALAVAAACFQQTAEETCWTSLSLPAFVELLSHEALFIRSEAVALAAVDRFLDAHPEHAAAGLATLLGTIHFEWMSSGELAAAETRPQAAKHPIPPETLFRAYRTRLARWEGTAAGPDDAAVRVRPCYMPVHVSLTDGGEENKGLFHLLGTDKTGAWRNPAATGLVRLGTSGVGNGQLNNVLERTACNFETRESMQGAWVTVDLGTSFRMEVEAYTMRHGRFDDNYAPRNWRLEASNNGRQWIVLREHVQDMSLDQGFGFATWATDSETAAGLSFRHFRIVTTGGNSTAESDLRLSLASLEFYGKLAVVDFNATAMTVLSTANESL